MRTHSSIVTKIITAGSLVAAVALVAPVSVGFNGFSTNAFAEEDHEGTSGHKGTKGGSDKGDKGKGAEGHGSKKDLVMKGQGEPDADSEGKGPKAGSGGRDGGKPIWASEGIPEGDYGRLNVARAPQSTRDKALAEALATVTNWTLYTKTLDEAVAAILASKTTPIVIVDSPTQSLALYQSLLSKGKVDAIGDNGSNIIVEAAIFFASAADKTKAITENTIIAINTILGVKLPDGVTTAEFALEADKVRSAIQTAHDSTVPVP